MERDQLEVTHGDVDADLYSELLTGPGPGVMFGPQVRGWDYDGTSIATIAKINYFPLSAQQYGVNVAGGDFDGDGYAEIERRQDRAARRRSRPASSVRTTTASPSRTSRAST
ncbi:MAG: hypothetical protein U0166_10930 [Acidobacteriota bacterium]